MGLEMVDIVIRTEAEFGIQIPDEDMLDKITVGQYYDYVLARLRGADPRKCMRSMMFYKVRGALIRSFGIARCDVRPDKALDFLLPPGSRRQQWARLSNETGLTMPSLARTGWARAVLGAGLAACAATALLASRGMVPPGIGVCGALGLFWLCWFRVPAGSRIPESCATVRGLVTSVVEVNCGRSALERQVMRECYRDPAVGQERWTDDEVWTKLQDIAIASLGVDRSCITRDAHWVHDLGAG